MASGVFTKKDAGEKQNKDYRRKNQAQEKADVDSDDSSNHNRAGGPTNGNAVPGYVKLDNFVKISFNLENRDEVRTLKRKLTSELDQVSSLLKKLEAKANSKPVNRSGMKMNSEVGSVDPVNAKGFRGSNVSVNEKVSSYGVNVESVGKVNKAAKMNQSFKDSQGVKRKENLSPMDSYKKLKTDQAGKGFVAGMDLARCFKNCGNLLERLMKHKFGWVFNKPVDVKGLGLHDYYTIIKHPMDLGTVKGRLTKKMYASPVEFAEDVRLTFTNAMLYNPKGQDVHFMAEQLLNMFEEKWKKLEAEFSTSRSDVGHNSGVPKPASRSIPNPPAPVRTPASAPPPRPLEPRPLERKESKTMSRDPKRKDAVSSHDGETPIPKKPKKKDVEKRDMTYEEKQKLSIGLQNLPSDKLETVVQIIKKRNPVLAQEDDEIEVDIDSFEPETLWELDRFVNSLNKSLSKIHSNEEFAFQASLGADHGHQDIERTVAEADHTIQDSIRTTSGADRDIQGTERITVDDERDMQNTGQSTVDADQDLRDTVQTKVSADLNV